MIRALNDDNLPPERHEGSAPSQHRCNNANGHGSLSPSAQSDGGYTTSSGPSPIAASAAYCGHGLSPGLTVPLSEIDSSGHRHANSDSVSNIGYEVFGAGAARLSAKEREPYGNAGSSGRLAVSNYADGENGD
ncbi:hypothetical protein D9756_000030 [Leucocoprinus leucothites]|uniref:Uncharacterized protein n=1 Tax=Leucocoprinus leucothites TaxID=201217 RepID=A0A8H5LN84_9AGAR|nr:hypothetical protein D9756_000030 [Leucoagaricus leucothites]